MFYYRETTADHIYKSAKVLVLHESNDVWHSGTIQDILKDMSAVSFDCLSCQNVFEVKPDELVPIHSEDADSKVCFLFFYH